MDGDGEGTCVQKCCIVICGTNISYGYEIFILIYLHASVIIVYMFT